MAVSARLPAVDARRVAIFIGFPLRVWLVTVGPAILSRTASHAPFADGARMPTYLMGVKDFQDEFSGLMCSCEMRFTVVPCRIGSRLVVGDPADGFEREYRGRVSRFGQAHNDSVECLR